MINGRPPLSHGTATPTQKNPKHGYLNMEKGRFPIFLDFQALFLGVIWRNRGTGIFFFVLFHFLFAESWLFGIFWMNELNLLNAWIFPWSLFGMVFVLDLLVYEAGDLTVLDFDLTYKSFYFCWLQWLNSMALTGCFLNCFGNGVLPSKVIKPHVLLMGKVNCEKK